MHLLQTIIADKCARRIDCYGKHQHHVVVDIRKGGSRPPGSAGEEEAPTSPALLRVPCSSGGVAVVVGAGLPSSCRPRLPLLASLFDAKVAVLCGRRSPVLLRRPTRPAKRTRSLRSHSPACPNASGERGAALLPLVSLLRGKMHQ